MIKIDVIDVMLRAESFMDRVKKTNSCWIWQGGKHPKGYGFLRIHNQMIKAHRFSYTLFVDDIKPNKLILHSCDNPSCVNPAHLRQGTNQDNVDDKMKRGRHYCWAKTHCPQGHEYDVLVKGKHRRCSICSNKQYRESKRKEYQNPVKREKVLARNRAAYWRKKNDLYRINFKED